MAFLPVVLDLIGIFVFALSGALLGVRIQFDIVGVLVIGAVTGLGGGIMRDVLIGAIPPASFTDWRYLVVSLVAGLVAFRFHPRLAKIERYVNWFDGVGLGLFCVLGTQKALVYGLDPIPAALMGVLTGVGGGVLRDLLANRMPIVLRQDVYALPALAGSVVVVMTWQLGLFHEWVLVPAAALCTVLRFLAIHYRWSAPRATDVRRG
ncbi:MAG TPA: trimeric intracellular cation channel family protein [Microlunatus sp.]|nr:trimeric intracellular cation channel family protein [Microlunatus sp.]